MKRFLIAALFTISLFSAGCRNTPLGALTGNTLGPIGSGSQNTNTGNNTNSGGNTSSGGNSSGGGSTYLPNLPNGVSVESFGYNPTNFRPPVTPLPAVSYPAQWGELAIGSQVQHTAYFANFGLTPILGLSISISPATNFSIVTNNCPAALGALESCQVEIRFSPRVKGLVTATLAADGSNISALSQPLSGTGLQRLIRLGAGDRHACGVTDDGTLKCWGDNNRGQLGTGNRVDKRSPEPVLNIGNGVSKVLGGDEHSCAILDGGLHCWGRNDLGQLGRGDTDDSHVPIPVPGMANLVTDVAASNHSTCAIKDGAVRCWGWNVHGEVGIGNTTRTKRPANVEGLPSPASRIAMGAHHTCTALENGQVWCWGLNNLGQLGDGTRTRRKSPVRVPGIANVKEIAAGDHQTCAIKNNGSLHCWGHGEWYALGNGDWSVFKSPTRIFEDGVTNVALGIHHGCAIRNEELICWGWNGYGQIGDGTRTARRYPVQAVDSTYGPIQLAAGRHSTYAILGQLAYSWGYGGHGRLGNGSTSNSLSPSLIPLD